MRRWTCGVYLVNMGLRMFVFGWEAVFRRWMCGDKCAVWGFGADMAPEKTAQAVLVGGGLHRTGGRVKSKGNAADRFIEPRGKEESMETVEDEKNDITLPAVSVDCEEAQPTGSSLYEETPKGHERKHSDADSSGSQDLKIGNMNPFKAYIVSRGAGTSTDRTHSVRRSGASFYQHDKPSGRSETLSPVRVIHTLCNTERGSIDGFSDLRADSGFHQLNGSIYQMDSTPKGTESTISDEEIDMRNIRVSIADTVGTIDYATLAPDTADAPYPCDGDEPNVQEDRAWESGITTVGDGSTARMNSSTYLDDFYMVPQGNLSIFSGDEVESRRDTNLTGSPEKLYSRGALSLDLTSTHVTQSIPSIAAPQGSEMEFSQLVGRRSFGPIHTPMGSASVDEVWDDLFAGGTTVQNGSAKTCLTSWEYFFPKNSHKEQSLNGTSSRTSISNRSMSMCSTMNHTNLESSPRDLDDVSSRWSGSDDDCIKYPQQFDVPSLKMQGENGTTMVKSNPPMHLLPAKAREEAKVHPARGDRVMNAFYTSQPSKSSKNPKGLLYHHAPHAAPQKINTEESCTGSKSESARSRTRFSVFLETGYPSAAQGAIDKQRADAVISPVKLRTSNQKGKASKKWRSILSTCSMLFKCFKEDSGNHPMALEPLEGISELPEEYEEYLRGGGKWTGELHSTEENIPENLLHLRICVQDQTSECSGHRPSRLISRLYRTF